MAKYFNRGKYHHVVGRHKDTGEMIESHKDLEPAGYDVGTAIVNFPGHGILKVVPAGEWVDLPDDLSEHVIKSACPSLLNEAEAKKAAEGEAKSKPAKAEDKGAAKADAKTKDKE